MTNRPPHNTNHHKILHIFRHGETDWNAQERFQGHVDIPLNEQGRKQAAALIEPLRAAGVQAILSSDLSRARETGEIVARSLGVPVYVDPGLREAHLGLAQGLTKEEIAAQFGHEMISKWKSNRVTDADILYPGGESGAQVIERTFASLEKFLTEDQIELQRIGVATHGGVIRRFMHRLLPDRVDPIPIPNGVLYRVEFHPGTRAWRTKIP